MVVKPIALVTLAGLVIVGAGGGAYLAVRDNRVAAEDPAETLADLSDFAPTDVDIDTDSGDGDGASTDADAPVATRAVEATEEVVGDEGDGLPETDAAPVPAQPPRATTPRPPPPRAGDAPGRRESTNVKSSGGPGDRAATLCNRS